MIFLKLFKKIQPPMNGFSTLLTTGKSKTLNININLML